MGDDAWCREAIRLYRRYQIEIVEALKLCPWAERARLDGQTTERVLLTLEPEPSAVVPTIATLGDEADIDIALLIFPRLRLDRTAFERFVSTLAAETRGRNPFAMAAFHPDAEPDTSDPERLIPFVRRTPDPTIQLVRMTALERVRKGPQEGTQLIDVHRLALMMASLDPRPPLRERIARANLETLERAGVQAVAAKLEDIRADRERTYAHLERDAAPCPT